MREECQHYEELISRLLDDDLSADEADSLRAHLRTCSDCRAMAEAFASIAQSLRTDDAEPPEALAAGVTERIRAAEGAPVPIQKKRRFAFTPAGKALIAACLVLVIGVGGFGVWLGNHRMGSAAPDSTMTAAAKEESAILTDGAGFDVPAAMEPMPAEAPAPMPEEADAGLGAGAYGAAVEAAEAEADTVNAAARYDKGLTDEALTAALSGFTLESPGMVPAERAADFEAILSDAGVTPGSDRTILCYIEYRGVIYEFSSDGAYLCWRDAAEGMPVASPASLYELVGITLS